MTKCTEAAAREAALVGAAQRVWDTIPATFDGPDAEEHSRALVALNVALTLISSAAAALLAQGEQARKIVTILKANGMNLGVVQVPPVIQDTDRLYALKDAVAAFDRAALRGESK